MAKLVVILGATGKQGGSVVSTFLGESSFKIRAVTRNVESAAARSLKQKGVEVVRGDVTEPNSLVSAFQNANYIYAMTTDIGVNAQSILENNSGDSVVKEAYRIELEGGKNIVTAAATAVDTLELFILSALSAAKRISGGRYQHIYHFDAKADTVDFLEQHYPKLAQKTAVLQLGMFCTNWVMPTPLKPTKQPDGRYRILMPCSADSLHPFIDPKSDPALFVKALATQPLPPPILPDHKLSVFSGYGSMISFQQWTKLLSSHLGVEVYFEETSIDNWASLVTAVPGLGLELAEMWNYSGTIGYFGGEKGGARKITELSLEAPPTNMEDYIKNEDWSSLFE